MIIFESNDAYTERMTEVCKRAEALETQGARRMREAAEAPAVAGPGEEHPDEILIADGGEDRRAGQVNAQLEQAHAELEDDPLHVGDHVQDADDPDATMVVIRDCDASASDYFIEEIDETVAEYNDCDPAERVYQVVFASRTDKDLADLVRYPYPRSRLEVVARVHDRDEGGEDDE